MVGGFTVNDNKYSRSYEEKKWLNSLEAEF